VARHDQRVNGGDAMPAGRVEGEASRDAGPSPHPGVRRPLAVGDGTSDTDSPMRWLHLLIVAIFLLACGLTSWTRAGEGSPAYPDVGLDDDWVTASMRLGDSLQASTLSAPAEDALRNPQLPRSPVESWITEVVTLARASSDPILRQAALETIAMTVVRGTATVASSMYLRLFEDLVNDPYALVRRGALTGLVVLWERDHLEAARQTIVRIADEHPDGSLRKLAALSLRGEPWPQRGRSVSVANPSSADWQTAVAYTQ